MNKPSIWSFSLLILAAFLMLPVSALAATDFSVVVDLFGYAGGGSCGSSAFETPCNANPEAGIFSSISCRVMKTFNAGIVPLYCNIVLNPDYQSIITAVMTLYVMIIGVLYVIGSMPMRLGAFMGKLLKVVIVYALVSDADLYFSLIYNTALKVPQEIVYVILNSPAAAAEGTAGSKDFFQYVDQGIGNVLTEVIYPEVTTDSGATYRKGDLKIIMAGLAIWQLGGDLIGGLFFTVMVGWIMAYFSIMIRYLLTMLFMMALLILGPIFIPMILFEKTKSLFEDWVRFIISAIMQIVLVVAFIIMTQGFYTDFYNMIKETMNSTVMKESTEKYTVPYGENSYGVVDKTGYTPQTADSWLSGFNFGGSGASTGTDTGTGSNPSVSTGSDKLPQITLQLLTMLIIVYLSFTFMQNIPNIAALLAVNPRMNRLFSTTDYFANKRHEAQARLFGQSGSGAKTESALSKTFSR